MTVLNIQLCFKKRTSDATKIRRFFCLCKHFCIVVTVSHLSLLRIFCARTKDCVSKDVRLLKQDFIM
ncbi:hypothetical protein DXA81_17525 [Bacteroides fragilis]|nr:hypothetical protein DXA81_17525 [Bacteroides fragilis]